MYHEVSWLLTLLRNNLVAGDLIQQLRAFAVVHGKTWGQFSLLMPGVSNLL